MANEEYGLLSEMMNNASNLTPEQAADHIQNADYHDITPDAYADLKYRIPNTIKNDLKIPDNLDSDVKDLVFKDNTSAALYQNDIYKMDAVQRLVKYGINNVFEVPPKERALNELADKMRQNGGVLSESDQEEYDNLELELEYLQNDKYGIDSKAIEIPTQVVAEMGDTFRGFAENYKLLGGLVGTAALTGAVTGGVVTSILGPFAPFGAGVGATGAVTAALPTIFGVVGGYDGFKQMTNSAYRELRNATDEKGNPIEIDETSKNYLSLGVGLIGGALEGLGDATSLGFTNVFLKKFISPKTAMKTILKSPELLSKMHIIGEVVKNLAVGGLTEGMQEALQITAVNLGKLDGTEASFKNVLSITADELSKLKLKFAGAVGKTISDPESRERIGEAAVIGGLAQGATSAGVNTLGYQSLKGKYEDAQAKVLLKQNQLLQVSALIKSMESKNLSPKEVKAFQKQLSTYMVDEHAFISTDKLKEIVNTREKQQIAKDILDPTGLKIPLAAELELDLIIDPEKYIQLATEIPETTDHMKLDPEGQSALDIRTDAQKQVERMKKAEARQKEILATLNEGETLSPEQEAEIRDIMEYETPKEGAEGEIEYIEKTRFEAIEGIVTEKQAADLNAKELDAKIYTAEILNAEAEKVYNREINENTRDEIIEDEKEMLTKQSHDLSVLELFKDTSTSSQLQMDVVGRHTKKGYSVFAIDPKSLTPEQQAKYLKNKKMMKRKAFVEGGLSLEDSAEMVGYESGDQLLQVLAETPNQKEFLKRLKENREARRKAEYDPGREMQVRNQAFGNVTKILREQMDYIKNNQWSTFKRGVVKIAGKVPTSQELNVKAKAIVNDIKVGDINANVKTFIKGVKDSKRNAMNAWFDTQFESTFKHLESAALKNEVVKELLNAKQRLAMSKKFIKSLSKEGNQKVLTKAGHAAAMNDILDAFNLDTSKGKVRELTEFNKFLVREVEAGRPGPVIPPRLSDTRLSSQDLSFHDYIGLVQAAQHIMETAKFKNKLISNIEGFKELRTAEKLKKELKEAALNHIDYNRNRLIDKNPNPIKNIFASTSNIFSTLKTISYELDEGMLGGFFARTFNTPIKDAYNRKRAEMMAIEHRDRKLINAYGMDKFKKHFNTIVDIPEFADFESLQWGRMRKIDLFTLMAYAGDPDARNAFSSFISATKKESMTFETIMSVLNRELDESDADLVQNLMVNRFKQFETRSFNLHKKTTGVESEMIQGTSFEHRGIVREGGYYPIERAPVPDSVKIEGEIDALEDGPITSMKEGKFYAKMRAAEQTNQNRMKQRVSGSKRPLILKFENMYNATEEVVHDLHFREVGIDLLKILKEQENIEHIQSIIGKKKFNTLVDYVKDVVSKANEKDKATVFKEQDSTFNKIVDKIHSLHAVNAIGYNLKSGLVQVDSLKNLTMRVGPKVNLYLAKAAAKIINNPMLLAEYENIASQFNPDIKFAKDNIDHVVNKHANDYIPADRAWLERWISLHTPGLKGAGQGLSRLTGYVDKINDVGFYFVRQGDKYNRMVATMALVDMFLAGDIKGYDIDRLNKMTDNQRAKAARTLVQQAVDLSLTATSAADQIAWEKMDKTKTVTRYFTDRRNGINTKISQAQKIKWAIKRGNYMEAAGYATNAALASGVSLAWLGAVRGGYKAIKDALDEDDALEISKDVGYFFLTAPIVDASGEVPLLDNLAYQMSRDGNYYRGVSTPFLGVFTDTANAVTAVMKSGMSLKKLKSAPKYQKKAVTSLAGYAFGLATGTSGLPMNALYKAVSLLDSKPVKNSVKEIKQELIETVDKFKETFGESEFTNDVEKLAEEMDPAAVNVDNTEVLESAKEAISFGNEWDSYDAETTEAGKYGFSEERWNEVSDLAPDLALTDEGRTSEDTSEQEAAMNWSLQDNAQLLSDVGVPVTNESLYGAHKFGIDSYALISISNPKDNLSKLLGDASKDPLFEKFKTVNDVKLYVKNKVKNALKQFDKN